MNFSARPVGRLLSERSFPQTQGFVVEATRGDGESLEPDFPRLFFRRAEELRHSVGQGLVGLERDTGLQNPVLFGFFASNHGIAGETTGVALSAWGDAGGAAALCFSCGRKERLSYRHSNAGLRSLRALRQLTGAVPLTTNAVATLLQRAEAQRGASSVVGDRRLGHSRRSCASRHRSSTKERLARSSESSREWGSRGLRASSLPSRQKQTRIPRREGQRRDAGKVALGIFAAETGFRGWGFGV